MAAHNKLTSFFIKAHTVFHMNKTHKQKGNAEQT